MFQTIESFIQEAATWLWGMPMIIVLSIGGIYFTFRMKGLQFSHLLRAAKLAYTNRTGSGEGNITPLQALYGALGGLIGNGNLAGAATAVFMGGPGALLWMWIGALVGMIITYVETLLALTSRERSADGTYSGGPMYYIQKILKLKWLAMAYAFVTGLKTLLGTSMIQSNSISLVASTEFSLLQMPGWIPTQLPFCVIVAILTWLIVIGGLSSIAKALEKITPLMILLYAFFGMIIIIANHGVLLDVLGQVFKYAFRPASISGGFAGASVLMAVRYGVARGFYSNEAGTGSAAIMYSTAKTENVYFQSLISMFGVFIDTVVSTFTLLIILVTGVWTSGLTSTALTSAAFKSVFGGFGGTLLVLLSFLLGYSTLIAWCFYGEQCFAYIWGTGVKRFFRWAFTIAIVFGFMRVELVWSIGDLLNGAIIIVNLSALIFLIKHAAGRTKSLKSSLPSGQGK